MFLRLWMSIWIGLLVKCLYWFRSLFFQLSSLSLDDDDAWSISSQFSLFLHVKLIRIVKAEYWCGFSHTRYAKSRKLWSRLWFTDVVYLMDQYFLSCDCFYQWIPTVVKIGPNWPINVHQRDIGIPFITVLRKSGIPVIYCFVDMDRTHGTHMHSCVTFLEFASQIRLCQSIWGSDAFCSFIHFEVWL